MRRRLATPLALLAAMLAIAAGIELALIGRLLWLPKLPLALLLALAFVRSRRGGAAR